ncbi:MAG: hypothetical protein AB1449_03255 [Chloroflexota bacterium]
MPAPSRQALKVAILAGAAALLACSLPLPTPAPPSETATIPLPTLTPVSSGPGTVTGLICYPSEPPLPPLTLYFANVDTGTVTAQEHTDGTGEYSVDLEPGTYVAYAWHAELSLGGSYSQAVPCGLTASCTDHSLIEFAVSSGMTTSGIDICDWYGMPGDVPTPPGGLPSTPPPAATLTATPPPGGVSMACDGIYQRFRLTDGGPSGKTASVDVWNGTTWVNVWNWAGGDPMIKQIQPEAGLYSFGTCEQFVVIPEVYAGSGAFLKLTVHRWNGAGLSEIFNLEGDQAHWTHTGDGILFEESVFLYNEPHCCACNRQVRQFTWDGSAFVLTASAINPTYSGTPPAECTP